MTIITLAFILNFILLLTKLRVLENKKFAKTRLAKIKDNLNSTTKITKLEKVILATDIKSKMHKL